MPNRLSPVPREALPEGERRFLDAVAAIRRRPISGPFITLLNSSPDLAARFAHLGHYFHARGQADESILPVRVRTLVALILSRALDSTYEWAAWVGWALEAGVPAALADALREGETPRDVAPEDALVLDFCNELLAPAHRVSDETYRAAQDRYGPQGVVELACTLGYFAMIAFPLNAFEIEMSVEQKGIRKPFEPLRIRKGEATASAALLPFDDPQRPAASARIRRVQRHEDLRDHDQHFLDRIVRTRGRIAAPFQVLLNSPDVAVRLADVGELLVYRTQIPPAIRALTWLIAAREYGCAYEWALALGEARRTGVTERVVEAVDRGEAPPGLPADQEAAAQFCYALLRGNHRVSDGLYAATLGHLGVPATVQVAATIGYFVMWSLVLNTFEVGARSDPEPML